MDESLVGYLSGTSELTGMLSETGQFYGELSVPERIKADPYEGPWDIIPDTDFNLLPTADRWCEDDILVHPIPYSEVSNTSGGYTAIIGG